MWIWKKCAKKHMLLTFLRVCEDSVFIDQIDIGQSSLCWCVWPHSKYSSQRQETSCQLYHIQFLHWYYQSQTVCLWTSSSHSLTVWCTQNWQALIWLAEFSGVRTNRCLFVCLFLPGNKIMFTRYQGDKTGVLGWSYHWIDQVVRFCLVNWLSKCKLVYSAFLHLWNSLYFVKDRVGYTVHLFYVILPVLSE